MGSTENTPSQVYRAHERGDSGQQAPNPSPTAWENSLFGWNIRDLNFTDGALLGYSSENSNVSLKVPEQAEKICPIRNSPGMGAQKPRIFRQTVNDCHPTSVPRRVLRPKYHSFPQHHIVRIWGAIHALRRVLLKSFVVSNEAL